jgi:hypothetical protein
LAPFSFEANLAHTRNFVEKWHAGLSPLEVEVLERGLASFGCAGPPAPYQAAVRPLVPPLVHWAALALLLRLWPLGIVSGLGIAALVLWRVRRLR